MASKRQQHEAGQKVQFEEGDIIDLDEPDGDLTKKYA